MNKGKVTKLLRKAGLMHAADRLRYSLMRYRNRTVNQEFKRQHPGVALPPDYLMYESFQLNYGKYYQGGRETAQWVVAELARFTSLSGKHILDWGCGPGRVIRHLPALVGAGGRFTGTDYNAQSIAWCRQHLPGITFLQNKLDPPLALPSESVDALYGISIFTHLSEASHTKWAQELLRVLKPGGLALLTTHGQAFRPLLTDEEKTLFDQGELVIRSNVAEGHRVFSSFQPVSFWQQLFLPAAEILDFIAGERHGAAASQDVWLLRKRE